MPLSLRCCLGTVEYIGPNSFPVRTECVAYGLLDIYLYRGPALVSVLIIGGSSM